MSNVKNSVYNVKNGRYTLGGETEVSEFALEWWSKNDFGFDKTDIIYYVEKKYENKPHMLGKVFYDDSSLWWIICQLNSIIDPLSDLLEGTKLRIPTLARVKSDLFSANTKSGGVPSTRGSK